MIKYGIALDQKRSLIDFVQTAPLDPNFKNDFVLLANESLIKAVESRLDKNPAEIDQAARQGYVLTPFFAEQLPVFEKQEQGMRFYFEEMANAIDLKKEDTRIGAIKFDAAPLVRVAKQVTAEAPAPVLSPSAATLEKAEDLYLKRNLDEAKQLYLKSLEQQGSAAEHAQAWYGLARISVLQNQPDAAIKLFEKTLGASPDGQTKAWTLVYLARLAKAAGDPRTGGKILSGCARRRRRFGAGSQSRSNRIQKYSEITSGDCNSNETFYSSYTLFARRRRGFRPKEGTCAPRRPRLVQGRNRRRKCRP